MGASVDADQAAWFLAVLRRTIVPDIEHAAPVGRPERWSEIVEYGARTRTLPVLGFAVEMEIVSPPAWAAHIFRSSRSLHAREAADMQIELERLSNYLVEMGVGPVFVRKGAATADLYPAPGMRPFGDIDLVVDPAQAAFVTDTLAHAGYEEIPQSRAARARYMVFTGGLVPFQRTSDDGRSVAVTYSVDVMRSVLPPQFGDTTQEAAFASARGRELAPACFAYDDAHAFLDTCASLFLTNVAVHYLKLRRFARLSLYLDLLVLLARDPTIASASNSLDARSTLATAVAYSLGNTARLFGDVAPLYEAIRACRTPATADVLDGVAFLEAPEPVRWQRTLFERIFSDVDLPEGLPDKTPIYR